jgi:hypothetical protein
MATTLSVRSRQKKNRKGLSTALAALLLLPALALGACATSRVEQMVPDMHNIQTAKHFFGEPITSQSQPGGTTRYEWRLNRQVFEPGHYRTKRVFRYNDSDGYPVLEDVQSYVKDKTVLHNCLITMVADRSGNLLQKSVEGNSCDELLQVPVM